MIKIKSSAIPHRWRNRFLRDANSNFSMGGSDNIANYSNNGGDGSSGNNFEPHYLWGQYFDDTEDINGDLTCDGTIRAEQIMSPIAEFGDVTANTINADIVHVNEKLTTDQLEAISGYIQTLLSDDITCDYLTVTKAAHFFKLIIDEIKATQGAIIITPANAKLDKVEAKSGGWRCYYRAKDDDGKQIYNCFEVGDQVVCQTFDAATGTSYNVSNQYYWRLVTATGSTTTTIDGTSRDVHYFDLSSSDCDSHSMTPKVGDNCVQLGNRTDTTRQAAIIISAYNSQFLDKGVKAPSIVQYQGINNYNLSAHRLNVISNGLNQFKTSTGQDLEDIINNGDSELNRAITALTKNTQDGLLDVNNKINTTNINFNTFSGNTNVAINTINNTVSSHTESISLLQQTDRSLTSAISANTNSISTLSGSVAVNTANFATLSGTVTSNTNSISVLQQTANSMSSTISANTTNIANLSATVTVQGQTLGTLNGKVTTNTTNISNLQQTANNITSTVSAHTNALITVNNSLASIEADYITSSQLNQTASSITASVTEDIEGELSRTGIDITAHKITMSSDNTEFVSSSGAKTWLIGKDSNGNTIFQLGREGNSDPWLRFQKTYTQGSSTITTYSHFGLGSLTLNGGNGATAGIQCSNQDSRMVVANGGNTLGFRVTSDGLAQRFVNGTWVGINGKYARKISSNTTLNSYDEVVFVTNGSTVTVPTSGNFTGRIIEIIRTGNNTVKITGNLNGSVKTIDINNKYEINRLIYDGSTWVIGWSNV